MRTEAAKKQGRDTVGKIAYDMLLKGSDSIQVGELGPEMTKKYMDNVWLSVERGKKLYDGDFFVVVLLKKEKLLYATSRKYFFPRKSCPTPTYNQTVFKYYRKDDKLDFIWTLPSQEGAAIYRDNALFIVDEERELLKFVLDYWDGTLDKVAQTLNGEKIYDLSLDYK